MQQSGMQGFEVEGVILDVPEISSQSLLKDNSDLEINKIKIMEYRITAGC